VVFQSESESELLYDWRFPANQFVLATSPLRLTASNFIFQLNTCGYNLYVTTTLTRGWVCRLQLLLVLASAVVLGSESCGTHDDILLSQIRDSDNLEGEVSVFVSPRNRLTRLYTQALGSLYVTSYNSQGYSGGIRTRLHMGRCFSDPLQENVGLVGVPQLSHECVIYIISNLLFAIRPSLSTFASDVIN
jgi:hypothetical protein